MPKSLRKKVDLISVNSSLENNREKPKPGYTKGPVRHQLGEVDGFPIFRLYKDHEIVEFNDMPSYKHFVKFLKEQL